MAHFGHTLCVALALLGVTNGLTLDEAKRNIQKDIQSHSGATDYEECAISAEESCPLANMMNDQSTLVAPGGETRCIFSEELSGPFKFQVIPGDRSKLLFYFQGGGACWDKDSTVFEPMCTTSAEASSYDGVFDRSNDENPFKDYTIVQVLYCSGDVHGGNVTRDYNDPAGNPVVQTGYENVKATIDWVIAQPDMQAVEDLVLMGCSAGSMGVQLWALEALERLKATNYARASVFPDSFVGIFSENVEGPLVRDYGYCNTSLCAEEHKQSCDEGTLLFKQIVSTQLGGAESVPFTFLNSKADEVQMSYYIAVAVSMHNDTTIFIDPSEYYYDVNKRFEFYDSEHKNAVLYLVQADQHCYTNKGYLYTADPTGKVGDGTAPALVDWTAQLPLSTGHTIYDVCVGNETLEVDKPTYGTRYCDIALEDHSFMQP